MSVSLYTLRERGGENDYPSWVDGAPNLQTYLTALNKSQPIIQCQYELVWSRWPRAKFFSKNITIPGLEVNTQELNHAGFTIKISTHVHYSSNEITLNIIADKEGFHYYDLRNMVLQTGHPLVAGDPKSTIGNPYGVSPDEDTIEVRLRNRSSDETHHHWIIHNFKPIELGDIELSQDSGSFVEFELKGTFTHITYDCGKVLPPEEPPQPNEEDVPPEEPPPKDEEDDEEDEGDDEEEEAEEEEEEDEDEEEEEEDPYYTDDEEPDDEDEDEDEDEEEEDIEDFMGECDSEDYENDDWEDWDSEDWGDCDEVTLAGDTMEIDVDGLEMEGEMDTIVAEPSSDDSSGFLDSAIDVASNLSKGLGALTDGLSSIATTALEGAGGILNSAIGAVSNIGGSIGDAAGGLLGGIGNLFNGGSSNGSSGSFSGEDSGNSGDNGDSGGSDGGEGDGDSGEGGQSEAGTGGDDNPPSTPSSDTSSNQDNANESNSKSNDGKDTGSKQSETTVEMSPMTHSEKLIASKTKLEVMENKLAKYKPGSVARNVLQRQVDLQKMYIEELESSAPSSKGGLRPRKSKLITKALTSSQSRQLSSLVKAVKFNHDIGKGKYAITVRPEEEISKYKERITQLTLPHRFGMYKPPTKDVPKTTKIELEDPQNNFIDSTSSRLANNPNHKVRDIFS